MYHWHADADSSSISIDWDGSDSTGHLVGDGYYDVNALSPADVSTNIGTVTTTLQGQPTVLVLVGFSSIGTEPFDRQLARQIMADLQMMQLNLSMVSEPIVYRVFGSDLADNIRVKQEMQSWFQGANNTTLRDFVFTADTVIRRQLPGNNVILSGDGRVSSLGIAHFTRISPTRTTGMGIYRAMTFS